MSIPWRFQERKNFCRHGRSVIFVITIASFVTSVIYKGILVSLNLEFLQTIVFILVIAALVQFVEMFLKKSMPPLYEALGVYLPLITTNCAVLGVALTNVSEVLQHFRERDQRRRYFRWIYHRHRNAGRCAREN